MGKLVIKTPELGVIEESKAEKIRTTFEPMVQMLNEFEASYNDIIAQFNKKIDVEVTQKAKRLRLDIGKVRIATGKLKDKQKEYIKLEDRAIMGVHNIIIWAVKEKEDKLKEIENYFEIQEAKRIEKLQHERVELLYKYVDDAQERDLASMDADVWEAFFATKKKEYNDRIEAEKEAERKRVAKEKAEAEERERIRKENEKLKKEREEREKQLRIEAEKRAKEEAERKAIEEEERKAREAAARKEREAYELKLKKEREERSRIEAELKAKAEAERKEKERIEAEKQAELQKGDSEKMNDFINDLSILKAKYNFKSKKYQKKYSDAGVLIERIINLIKQ